MKRRRRINNKVKRENFCSSIESLPNELLTDIVARVASFSFKSLINAKLRPELAVEFLKQAAKGGHFGALYVIGIIMIFMGGEFNRKGVMLIGSMKETVTLRKITRECRKKLLDILRNFWVKKPLVLEQIPTRCTIQHQRHIRTNGWPVDSDDEDNEDADFHCDACSCDVEIDYIVEVLPKN
ncbi:unnamed protein product [Withania somnifera]